MATPTATVTATQASPPEPHLTIAARQEYRTITQTIRLSHTTFVTEVTLGGPPRIGGNDATATAPPAVPASRGGSSLTGAELGGILGGVMGFVVVAILIWCCVIAKRRQLRQEQAHYEDEMYGSDDLSDEPPHPRRQGRQTRQFHMPAPPPPIYQVNRRPPWSLAYSGPRRHLWRGVQ